LVNLHLGTVPSPGARFTFLVAVTVADRCAGSPKASRTRRVVPASRSRRNEALPVLGGAGGHGVPGRRDDHAGSGRRQEESQSIGTRPRADARDARKARWSPSVGFQPVATRPFVNRSDDDQSAGERLAGCVLHPNRQAAQGRQLQCAQRDGRRQRQQGTSERRNGDRKSLSEISPPHLQLVQAIRELFFALLEALRPFGTVTAARAAGLGHSDQVERLMCFFLMLSSSLEKVYGSMP
jgi:hypothetical protein